MKDYYDTCAFPKPKSKKKKLLYNGYKGKAERHCYICGTPYAERHEVFCGSNRQNSIRYGYQVDVCPAHHKELQDNITDFAQEENWRLKEGFEWDFIISLEQDGLSREEALTAWMAEFGRNYISELTPK